MYISFIHVFICSILKHMFEEFGKKPFPIVWDRGKNYVLRNFDEKLGRWE